MVLIFMLNELLEYIMTRDNFNLPKLISDMAPPFLGIQLISSTVF